MNEMFKCAHCKQEFEKVDTPEEEELKINEYKENFPNDPDLKCPTKSVCDGCYLEFKIWLDTLTPIERKEIDRRQEECLKKQ